MACCVRLEEWANAASEDRRGLRIVDSRSRNGGPARSRVADDCVGLGHAGGGISVGPADARSLEGCLHDLPGSAREGSGQMAPKLRKRIAKTVGNALMERDRMEMRAVEVLLSVLEQPRRRRTRTR